MSEAVREHMGDALEELSIQVERWKHQIGSCLLHSSLCQSLGWQSEDRLYHALHQINRTTTSRHRHSSDSSMQEGAYNCVTKAGSSPALSTWIRVFERQRQISDDNSFQFPPQGQSHPSKKEGWPQARQFGRLAVWPTMLGVIQWDVGGASIFRNCAVLSFCRLAAPVPPSWWLPLSVLTWYCILASAKCLHNINLKYVGVLDDLSG